MQMKSVGMKYRGRNYGIGQRGLFTAPYHTILFAILVSTNPAQAALPAPGSVPPVAAVNGMVVSQHYLATHAALEVLKEGGNAGGRFLSR